MKPASQPRPDTLSDEIAEKVREQLLSLKDQVSGAVADAVALSMGLGRPLIEGPPHRGDREALQSALVLPRPDAPITSFACFRHDRHATLERASGA